MNGRPWKAAEVKLLKSKFAIRQTKDLAAELGCEISRVQAMASKIGLKKKPEGSGWLKKGHSQPGTEKGRFPKGQIPFNKGLRRPGWFSGRMRETQFKKGQMAGAARANWKPVGTIQADPDGYLRIKVRERASQKKRGWRRNVWPLLNRRVWEQHHGPIPPNHIVTFRDRDRSNCAIENLELISMAENARRNAMWNRYPIELSRAIMSNGALKRKIRSLRG